MTELAKHRLIQTLASTAIAVISVVFPGQFLASQGMQQFAQMESGPKAGITLKVVDDMGDSVAGAEVIAKFKNVPNEEVSEGVTDIVGSYYSEGRTISNVWFGVSKAGYYQTGIEYNLARNAPRWDKPTKPEKWLPWNPTFTVALKKIRRPVPMYAKEIESVRLPLGKLVGFDLAVGDLVAPHGKGNVPDVVFEVQPPKAPKSRRFLLSFRFPGSPEGIQLVELDQWSGFLSQYAAPEHGYLANFTQEDQLFRDNPLDVKRRQYILRVRTVQDNQGRIRVAHYARLSAPISVTCNDDQCRLSMFTYWYNPDGTRNLEFDPRQNLLKNLKVGESPRHP